MNNEEAPKRVEEDEDGVKSCEQNLNPGGGDAGGSVLWCGRVEGPGNPSWTLRRSARSRALLLRTSLLLKKPHGRPRERPTMSSMATDRLKSERSTWRKDHPVGFHARPKKKDDGSADLMEWVAGIPGKAGTDWEGGLFNVEIKFDTDYPLRHPEVYFNPCIFHPNVYPSGRVCLSILSSDWKPSITLKQILLGVQELLDNPNNDDPAQSQASHILDTDPDLYRERIRDQARLYSVNGAL